MVNLLPSEETPTMLQANRIALASFYFVKMPHAYMVGPGLVGTSSSIITAASSSSRSWKYDVFLSFRGEDTRKTFVDHLYKALEQHGILTFKDDVTLDRGDTIGPSLLKAIQESHIALIIFSENYADSSWCLDELSYIMKCNEQERGQIVMPIFYSVDPSDVRKQKGRFGKAFAKHKKNKNKLVESWKKALVDASNIAGWEPKHVANGHEAKCIQEIISSILDKLKSFNSNVDNENLVGIGTRLQELKSHLRIGSGGVRMVGIWGVGGGAKTTLATSLYMEMKISGHFDGFCFVENIREGSTQQNGLKCLQEKILSAVFDKEIKLQSVDIGKLEIKDMLCRRKVLIVLDDVHHLDQLKALAGSCEWFGDGSRIIITTRDEHLLKTHRVNDVSPISLLSRDEAIQLFKKHAYCEDEPVHDYEMLSHQIVSYAGGLPLALIVLGSFLYDKSNNEWLDTLGRLKYHPEMDIVEKLKISYDGLKDVEKELFLDIACFYRGRESNEVMEMLDACGFYPHIGVKVLIQKALITVSTGGYFAKGGYFDMHDLVQEMGHYIVRGMHPNNPEKHSRVWLKEDIEDICSRNATMENNKIEAIECNVDGCSSNFIMLVSNMKKLRFLKVKTSSDEGASFLSNKLRYMEWERYPASPFPESFQPTKLVVLKMTLGLQKELWEGYKCLPCLKELQLFYMRSLVRIPDMGGLRCLQKLILFECGSLEEIHQSLGNHASLVHISVSYCKSLKRFPSIVRMEKLKTLKILCCEALVEFPKIETYMDNLVTLSLGSVGIEILPSSVGEYCTNLTLIKLESCSNLKSIEGNFQALKCLKNFELYECNNFKKFPENLFTENLDELSLKSDSMSSIKRSILSHPQRCLTKLSLSGCCFKDGEIPNEIGELSNLLELDLSANDFTRLDFSLSRLTHLKILQMSGCHNLVELPQLPSNLAVLTANNCKSLDVIIRDEVHTNCKCLCKVSIIEGRKHKIGAKRLLETMLQGTAIEIGCIILQLEGLEIPKEAENFVVRGSSCRMQLPENWYSHFSGFLFCVVSVGNIVPAITMKHVEMGGSVGMGGSHRDVYWEEINDDDDEYERVTGHGIRWHTWVGYISFGLLRNKSWWDQTSTAIQIEIDIGRSSKTGCGLKLVTKTSETSSIIDPPFDFVDACRLQILHDSKSAFEFRFNKLFLSED